MIKIAGLLIVVFGILIIDRELEISDIYTAMDIIVACAIWLYLALRRES